MTTVQNNSAVSSDLLGVVNGKKSEASTVQEAQDRFMKLLVTQMRNQDPLNPLDNAQVTSQMAQLSTVTGIDKLNVTLQALQANYQTSQAFQATDMIGHGVLVPGSDIHLSEGQAIFGVDLKGAADAVQVTIRNAAGVAVRTMNLGAQDAGTMPLPWDGKDDAGSTVADGAYRLDVKAIRGADKVEAVTLSFGEVASVTTGAQGVKLNVPGMGAINFADVRQVL